MDQPIQNIRLNQRNPNNRFHCYSCNTALVRRVMVRINGEQNAAKREIAINRRIDGNMPEVVIDDETRICNNCNISIVREIRMMEEDPHHLRLNVLTQTSSHSCLLCNAANDVMRLPMKSRVDIFVKRNIFVPDGARCCPEHLNEDELIPDIFQEGLRFINRPCKIKGNLLHSFLQALRTEINEKSNREINSERDFSDEEFHAVSLLNKEDFNDLYSVCDPVLQHGVRRNVTKKHLLTFLCKMKQGLSDEFLAVIFLYSCRRIVGSESR